MSIFKSTLDPTIAAQLKAREHVITKDSRDDVFLRFTTGKNSWVRMTSLVNANYNCKRIKDKDNKDVLGDDKKVKQNCDYYGDQLSRKYVLEGGTLYQPNKDNFLLRRGVAQSSGIYGSSLDKVSSSDKALSSRDLGLRPMPGITSVSIANKSAYGSLREATIEYTIWDRHQLEEMEVLFMRPGYSVFLEWGWSQYINHGKASGINAVPNNITIENFNYNTIDPFNDQTEDSYYSAIDSVIEKTKGNYDAMIGLIKNFSWQLTNDGGYKCTTVLISRGEVLETLKASSNPNVIVGSFSPPPQTNPGTGNENPALVLSLFEKIFLTIKGGINSSEVTQAGGEIYQQLAPPPPPTTPPADPPPPPTTPPQQQLTPDQVAALNQATAATTAEIKKGYDNIKQGLTDPNIKYKWDYKSGLVETPLVLPSDGHLGLIKVAEASTEGTGIEYISFITFVAILNRFFIPRDQKTGKPVLQIVIPAETPCLMSEDSVSVDPLTCLIGNKAATFITDTENATSVDNIGFNPILINNLGYDVASKSYTNSGIYVLPDFSMYNAKRNDANGKEYNITNLGKIGNIYIAIGKILSVYRGLANENGVDITTLLTTLLSDISFALGGINDFKLYTNRNIVQIIDAKYLEEGQTAKDKYQLTLFGLNSICRNVQLNSRIFAEQSTMIGIAAGSSENSNNLGDIYSSTQQYFNRGLSDRIIKDLDIKFQGSTEPLKDKDGNPVDLYYYNIYQNLASLSNYLNRRVLGIYTTKYNISDSTGNGLRETKIPQSEEVTNAGSLLKSFHYQINGKDVDYKSLIPFELEITIDGMGGFIVGQIFTINRTFPSVIPKTYLNKNLGFIITGISHSLQNNDWTTILKTQICLLDNIDISPLVDRNKLKNIVKEVRAAVKSSSYIISAMADYMIYLTLKIMAADLTLRDEEEPKLKQPFLAGNATIDNCDNTDKGYLYDFLNEKYKKDHLNLILSGIFYKPDLTPDVYKEAKSFNEKEANTNYLYLWWNENKGKGYEAFPQEFKKIFEVTTVNGGAVDLKPLIDAFKNYLVTGYNTNFNTKESREESKIKKEDIFIHKLFSQSGLAADNFKNQFSSNFTFCGSDPDNVISLVKLYNFYFGIIYSEVTSKQQELATFLRPEGNVSSEADLKTPGKGQYTLYRTE